MRVRETITARRPFSDNARLVGITREWHSVVTLSQCLEAMGLWWVAVPIEGGITVTGAKAHPFGWALSVIPGGDIQV